MNMLEEEESRSLDVGKTASIDMMALNNMIVSMRSISKSARGQVIQKLLRQIRTLQKKQGPAEKIEKNKRKVDRFFQEMEVIKHLKPDKISKFAMSNTMSYNELCKKDTASIEARALVRLSECCILQGKVGEFRKTHADWQSLSAYLLMKQSGRQYKKKKNTHTTQTVQANIIARETMLQAYFETHIKSGAEKLKVVDDKWKVKLQARISRRIPVHANAKRIDGDKDDVTNVSVDVKDVNNDKDTGSVLKNDGDMKMLKDKCVSKSKESDEKDKCSSKLKVSRGNVDSKKSVTDSSVNVNSDEDSESLCDNDSTDDDSDDAPLVDDVNDVKIRGQFESLKESPKSSKAKPATTPYKINTGTMVVKRINLNDLENDEDLKEKEIPDVVVQLTMDSEGELKQTSDSFFACADGSDDEDNNMSSLDEYDVSENEEEVASSVMRLQSTFIGTLGEKNKQHWKERRKEKQLLSGRGMVNEDRRKGKGGEKDVGQFAFGRGADKFGSSGKKRKLDDQMPHSSTKKVEKIGAWSKVNQSTHTPALTNRNFKSSPKPSFQGVQKSSAPYKPQEKVEALHPSWQASKLRKEQQRGIHKFSGTRIKFDDSD